MWATSNEEIELNISKHDTYVSTHLHVNYAHLYAVQNILAERKLNTERKKRKRDRENLWHSIEYVPIYIHIYFKNII